MSLFLVMTPSEFHLAMTSGFSTIAGSVLSAFIALGVPPENLVTASIMSIPASISISKLRYPETEEPVTRGQVVVARGEEKSTSQIYLTPPTQHSPLCYRRPRQCFPGFQSGCHLWSHHRRPDSVRLLYLHHPSWC